MKIEITKSRRAGGDVRLVKYDAELDLFRDTDGAGYTRHQEWDTKSAKAYATTDAGRYSALMFTDAELDEIKNTEHTHDAEEEKTMKETTELIRANKVTVRNEGDRYVADFYRTHRKITNIKSGDTGWQPNPEDNKTAQRESFRQYIINHAADIGINYDPLDRRADVNQRKAVYRTMDDVADDVVKAISSDINRFVSKMPNADMVTGHSISVDGVTPMTHTSKGTNLVDLGIDDGCYANGNMAWFDIEVTVVLTVGVNEIYQPVPMQLVSGQLKKMAMTQTLWNTETHKSLVEAGLVQDTPKDSKENK